MVVLTTACAALLSLPCALTIAIRSDNAAIRRVWVRRSRADQAAYCLLEQGFRDGTPAPVRASRPSVEHAAAELRRLDQQRRSGLTFGSEMWLVAVLRAYDEWLQVACGCLGISQHLSALDGIDRQIERVRMEGELTAAGLQVHSPADRLE
jgi:hypothetical protein